jgi:hypothetical protein
MSMNGLATRIKRRDMHFGIGMGHRTGITNIRMPFARPRCSILHAVDGGSGKERGMKHF